MVEKFYDSRVRFWRTIIMRDTDEQFWCMITVRFLHRLKQLGK